MRVRLQLLAPFRESKLLLPLPATISTISELKKHIRQSLSTVRDTAPSTKDILLEIDGFELLAGSLVRDVVEEKDVITIRLRAESSARKRSASASVSVIGGGGKRRKVEKEAGPKIDGPKAGMLDIKTAVQEKRASSPSSSSSSSSSSSPSSSSSSSSPSSSSSSPSSSSTSTASIISKTTGNIPSSTGQSTNPSFPIIPPHLRVKANSNTNSNTNTGPQSYTPPGQGKEGTHNRNLRRRLARQMKKLAEEGNAQSLNGGTENGDGDGKDETGPEQLSLGDITTFTTSELPVPKSMANRNKKRGFMKEMQNAQGTKIVFGSDAQASSTPVADIPIDNINETTVLTPQPTGTSTMQRRVLPPSEMDLPSNVFVSHQVYDRRGWTPRGRAARHRAEAAVAVEQEEEEEMEMEMDVEEEEEEPKQPIPMSAVPVDLPNGAVDLFSPAKGYSDDDNMWTKAEERFDELPIIDRQSLPARESIIAWKELQLCTYSFTPQLKAQLGEVVDISNGRMVVRRLERYDADEDDPFNGQPAELVVESKDWEGAKGNYRFIADPIGP